MIHSITNLQVTLVRIHLSYLSAVYPACAPHANIPLLLGQPVYSCTECNIFFRRNSWGTAHMFYDLSFHECFSKRRKENSIVPWPCLTYSKSLTFDPWKSGEARLPKNVSPLSMHRERTLTRHSRETRGCERCAIPSRGMRASSPLLIHPLSTLDKYSGNNTDGWWWGETCVSYTRLSCRSCRRRNGIFDDDSWSRN